jgi:PAS domain S-box-containing protein
LHAQHDVAPGRREAFAKEARRPSATGIFTWKVATDAISWSKQLYRIFELEEDQAVNFRLIHSRVHPDDLSSLLEIIEHARAMGCDFEHEHRLLMPDRSVKYLHVAAHGTRDERGGELKFIGMMEDVTQRRIAEEELCKARLELAHVAKVLSLGLLTASVAHEINQPLCGVIINAGTCLRMLNADPPDLEGARTTAGRILRDGRRASDVIERLRALFGKQAAQSELVDINEATREVVAMSLNELHRRRITLLVDLADNLPPVMGDRVQLQQVILNLVLNAADAMSGIEDGLRQLVIRTEPQAVDRVRLSVKDVGVGLAAQLMSRLFEPFYTTKAEGMGIGLFVSRTIIESYAGELQVVANEGPGVTFSFSIPVTQSRSAA